MTDKELRRLKRTQLLEILFYLQKELDRLKQENEELKQRLEVNGEIPEKFEQQLEQIVRKAVSDYFNPKPSEKTDDQKNNSEEVRPGHDGECDDPDK